MKIKLSLLLMLLSFCGFSQITVDESLTTQQLVEDVLINSDCAEVSNFMSSTGTDFGDDNGIAAFNAEGTDFPFEAGIILTSGNVANAPGPNFDTNSDGGGAWPGDPDLEAFTTATDTNNASWIQFDFVPAISEISFDFIMASEEYNQLFECTYSDAFAFILTDQATGDAINLAVIPDTTVPIEVTNIRYEVPGLCDAINEEYFGRYNFLPAPNTLPYIEAADAPIDYNGQTVLLTATADVVVGNTYTIKLVVADEQDTAFDMAVFLGANSFNIGNVDFGEDISIENGTAACAGDNIILDAGEIEGAVYKWFKDGVELEGETNSTLEVNEPGLYGIEVTLEVGDCTATDEILIEYRPGPIYDLGEDQLICEGEEIILDATPSNPEELVAVAYKWFKDGVEIVGEVTEFLTVSEFGVYMSEVNGNGCVVTDEVTIDPLVFTVNLGSNQEVCDQESFPLVANVSSEVDPTVATYLWSTGETSQGIEVSDTGTYSVTVTYLTCVETGSVTITFSENPIIELGESFETCFEDNVVLDASPSNYDPAEASYVWSLDGTILTSETTNTIFATQAGTYNVLVTVGICSSEDTIVISQRDDLIVGLGDDFKACPNDPRMLTATTQEEGVTYQWYKNGDLIEGEDESVLTFSLPPSDVGTQIFSVVISLGQCSGTSSAGVTLYDVDNCVISEGLSPNGDGMNDCLDLEFIYDRTGNFSIEVFNRYGMSVYSKANYIKEFCGVTNDGTELPTGTYFYVMKFDTPDSQFGAVKTGWIYINKESN